MNDYILRASAANGQIRAFMGVTTNTAEKARRLHDLSPVSSIALGRLLTAGALMGAMSKSEKDILTIQVKGDGPIEGLTVTASNILESAEKNTINPHVTVGIKGYVNNPHVYMSKEYGEDNGFLNVGKAIGRGGLTIIKDLGLKEPYVGTTDLQTGEIAEDLTYYFAMSEQTPSAVGLCALPEKSEDGFFIKSAGGFIIQLLPFAEEDVAEELERVLSEDYGGFSLADMLERGANPEDILESLLGRFGVETLDRIPVGFICGCGRERIAKVLAALGREGIQDLTETTKQRNEEFIEVNCHFCNSNYKFTLEDLENMQK